MNKVYDGTTAATVDLSDDRVAGDVVHRQLHRARRSPTRTSAPARRSASPASRSAAPTPATTPSNTTAIDDRRHHGAGADGHGDGRQQGLRRHHRRDRDAVATTASAGDVFTDATRRASVRRQERRHRQDGQRQRDLDQRDRRRQLHVQHHRQHDGEHHARRADGQRRPASNKVYDGTTTATVTLCGRPRRGRRRCTDSYTSARFADKNVGTGKTVSVSGISDQRRRRGQLHASTPTATTTANITARALTVTATASNKVYDGTTAATVTLVDNRVAGDVFTDSYTQRHVRRQERRHGQDGQRDRDLDLGHATRATTRSTRPPPRRPTSRRGADGHGARGVNKVYDGTTTATVTLSRRPRLGRRVHRQLHERAFADKNVGTGKTVSVSGISISGTDAGNYTSTRRPPRRRTSPRGP